jgi:hypothetical protein
MDFLGAASLRADDGIDVREKSFTHDELAKLTR